MKDGLLKDDCVNPRLKGCPSSNIITISTAWGLDKRFFCWSATGEVCRCGVVEVGLHDHADNA